MQNAAGSAYEVPALIVAAKAVDAGLTFRPLETSVADTLVWTRGSTPPQGIGLSAEQEQMLLSS